MNLSHLLILVAVVLFVWCAFLACGWVDEGNFHFLQSMGLASFALAHLPFANRQVF